MADQFSKYNKNAEQEKQDLASTMKRGQQKISEVATKGDPTEPLDSEAARHYLGQIRAANEQYAPTAPPESKKSLAQALDRAEQLYKDQATKNEWLEVAQILGRAGLQFAAAQAGMRSGRNMAALEFGPGIDYNARIERARQDYKDTVRNLAEMSQQQEQEYLNREKANQQALERSKEAAERGLTAALRESEIARKERADRDRERRSERIANDREDKALRAQQLRDLEGQEREISEQLKWRQSAVNQIQQMGDLSNKSVEQLEKQLGTVAARGGLDLAELKADLDKQTKPGALSELTGGLIKTTDPDEEKQSALLKGKIDELRNLLDGVRARKADILRGKSAPATQESPGGTGETPKAPPPSTKKVKGPSGQVVEFPEEIANKYLSRPGYTEVK